MRLNDIFLVNEMSKRIRLNGVISLMKMTVDTLCTGVIIFISFIRLYYLSLHIDKISMYIIIRFKMSRCMFTL